MDNLRNLTGKNVEESTNLSEVSSTMKYDAITPVSIPSQPDTVPVTGQFGTILSPEEAKSAGISGQGNVIDVQKEAFEAENRRYQEIQEKKKQDIAGMFEDVLKEEEDRLQRLNNTLNADDETRTKLLGNNGTNGSVTYDRMSYEDRKKDSQRSSDPEIDPFDLMPSYDEESDPTPTVEEDNTPNPGDDQYGEFIRDLTVVSPTAHEDTAVKIIKTANVDVISNKKNVKSQTVGDQAFLNAISKFKKDKFGKVTVVLPNSGFMCDIVGTGVVDLTNLYMNVNRNMDTYDYQMEQMRTIIKNVVGTSPKVNPSNLASMIHHRDFMMMAYGHICATLEKVETVANCTECGKPFRISSSPTELIMNMNDLITRTHEIQNAPNIEAYSLMTDYHTVTTSNGIEVYLGHPSYQELIRCIRGYQEYKNNMSAADAHRFETMLPIVNLVRKVKLPNGITSNNIYQSYQALLLLSQEDIETVQKEINKMNDAVIEPKFGISEVVCPHCGKVVKDIAYDGLLDMLFYHTTISSYLSNPED